MWKRRTLQIITLVLFGCFVLGVAVFARPSVQSFPEASSIGMEAPDFATLSDRFKKLADEKGAVYAFDILRRAELPSGTDLHLMGHVVGDELYKQKGLDGIQYCTQEFRNACSHTIVIGALNEFGSGDSTLKKIDDACKKAPGGLGAYTMCYHGLGHGVFAYFGYDLRKTVSFCEKMGTSEYHGRQGIECIGGAIMELVGGGGHDHDTWLRSREKYLSSSDPLAPCSSNVIPPNAKPICYLYVTPQLFASQGGDLANPSVTDFKTAFEACDRIAKSEPQNRSACFAGIGKEFPGLALARDIRSISNSTDAQLQQMEAWCAVAPNEESYTDCSLSIVDSLFWGGENDPSVASRYCSFIDGERGSMCFQHLLDIAKQYIPKGSSEAAHVCATFPESRVVECKSRLL